MSRHRRRRQHGRRPAPVDQFDKTNPGLPDRDESPSAEWFAPTTRNPQQDRSAAFAKAAMFIVTVLVSAAGGAFIFWMMTK